MVVAGDRAENWSDPVLSGMVSRGGEFGLGPQFRPAPVAGASEPLSRGGDVGLGPQFRLCRGFGGNAGGGRVDTTLGLSGHVGGGRVETLDDHTGVLLVVARIGDQDLVRESAGYVCGTWAAAGVGRKTEFGRSRAVGSPWRLQASELLGRSMT